MTEGRSPGGIRGAAVGDVVAMTARVCEIAEADPEEALERPSARAGVDLGALRERLGDRDPVRAQKPLDPGDLGHGQAVAGPECPGARSGPAGCQVASEEPLVELQVEGELDPGLARSRPEYDGPAVAATASGCEKHGGDDGHHEEEAGLHDPGHWRSSSRRSTSWKEGNGELALLLCGSSFVTPTTTTVACA